MTKIKISRFSGDFLFLLLTLLLEVMIMVSFTETLKAQVSSSTLNEKIASREILLKQIRFKPPKTGAPDNRRGGASRGGSCGNHQNDLQALLPDGDFGLTLEPYPTFFVYVPSSSSRLVEFELREQHTNEVFYKTRFKIPDTPGIVSFSLPNNKTIQPLEVGKNYRWFFALICNPQERSEDLYVQGWIQRIKPNATLSRQLEKATPRDRPAIYAQSGIWYETLSKLAELRLAHPQDPTLTANWTQLLKSVGLNQVADAPIVY